MAFLNPEAEKFGTILQKNKALQLQVLYQQYGVGLPVPTLHY